LFGFIFRRYFLKFQFRFIDGSAACLDEMRFLNYWFSCCLVVFGLVPGRRPIVTNAVGLKARKDMRATSGHLPGW